VCGRFNILTDADTLMRTFNILPGNFKLEPFEPRYNISPSTRKVAISSKQDGAITHIPIVRLGADGRRHLTAAIWPLIPVWANAEVPKYATANARAETMVERPSFRNAWQQAQRCLVPATGFYEWQNVAGLGHKQPWHIWHTDQALMAFAGLWEKGRTADGTLFESCAIVTTKANQLMTQIHNTNQRMPVIVDADNRDQWLGRDSHSALQLTASYADGRLQAVPISTRINNPNYTYSDCLEPLD